MGFHLKVIERKIKSYEPTMGRFALTTVKFSYKLKQDTAGEKENNIM